MGTGLRFHSSYSSFSAAKRSKIHEVQKVVQTITYMPHFISLIVICGLIHIFTQSGGILTQLVNWITGTEHSSLLGYAQMFRPIYTFPASGRILAGTALYTCPP